MPHPRLHSAPRSGTIVNYMLDSIRHSLVPNTPGTQAKRSETFDPMMSPI